jgi:hypothetical protein
VRFELSIPTRAGVAAAAAGIFLSAQTVWADCPDLEVCRRADAVAEDIRKDFRQGDVTEVYRLIDVRRDDATVVVEVEVQAEVEGLTKAKLEEVRARREASRFNYFCQESLETRQLIEAGVSFRVRHVSKNGIILNDITISDCGQNE